jgi:maltose/maltodextrin transport system permease protein
MGPSRAGHGPARLVALLLALASLAAVVQVHRSGQTLLAVMLLVVTAAAGYTYGSTRTQALRYLFPGVAAALVFVVFPMLTTIGIGFTNASSSNLLDHARARQVLLEESTIRPGSARPFVLHREGGSLRVWLPPTDGRPGLLSEPWQGLPTAPQVLHEVATPAGQPLDLRDTVAQLDALRLLALQAPGGERLALLSLREMAEPQPLFAAGADGGLTHQLSGTTYRRDDAAGFYTSEAGDRLTPGYRVGVGLAHYERLFTDERFREPFLGVFVWTVVFAAASVALAAGLGLVLAVLLNWEPLQGKGAYRLVLFLPYAVPGFISILVFKGLFNQNLGEVNLVLDGLFGIRPAWFSDPTLARAMLLVVNVWLGFPYMMVLCSGLIKSIPADLYEASAVAGAGAWTNFRAITMPLILKPLTPLLISAFAFNFNNFVLVSLLTGGRPDQPDASTPVGTTDILVSYTWRIAFQDSGAQFGLASAISTVIFLLVAAVTLLQMRATRLADEAGPRR